MTSQIPVGQKLLTNVAIVRYKKGGERFLRPAAQFFLIDLINGLGLREKFYPAKLKELRSRLGKTEPDAPASGEEDPSPSEVSLHPLAAALNVRLERAAA